jgi:hypothetical protein
VASDVGYPPCKLCGHVAIKGELFTIETERIGERIYFYFVCKKCRGKAKEKSDGKI